jgi:hypothetical protein
MSKYTNALEPRVVPNLSWRLKQRRILASFLLLLAAVATLVALAIGDNQRPSTEYRFDCGPGCRGDRFAPRDGP